MSVEPSIHDIAGKCIQSVVVSEAHTDPPYPQIFLVVEDGTAHECHGPDLSSASSLDSGGMDAVPWRDCPA